MSDHLKERIETAARLIMVGVVHAGGEGIGVRTIDGVLIVAAQLVERIDLWWEHGVARYPARAMSAALFRSLVESGSLGLSTPATSASEAPPPAEVGG